MAVLRVCSDLKMQDTRRKRRILLMAFQTYRDLEIILYPETRKLNKHEK